MLRSNFSNIIINILIIYVAMTVTAKRHISLELEKVTCRHNASEFIGGIGCSIRRDNDNITKVNVFIYLTKTVEDFDVRYVLEMSRNNFARIKIMELKVNACDFLKVAQTKKILKIFKDLLTKSINVVPKCPIEAPFNYTVTDFYMDANLLPANFPTANFRNNIFVYQKNRLMLTVEAMARTNEVY